uniref:CCHC-type domain-containing protein n=1 Tax=Kalanchoe fedtschenkoi TaxID=63787 RepID=A0A7N0U0L5_KALFE
MLDLENLIEEKFKGLKISTLEEEFTGRIESSHKDYKPLIQDEINKLYKYNNNPTYYNRPSPVDILHEEQEYILNNSYIGKNIYEWNLDGYTEKQIYNLVHRMLMYSTISKTAGNTDSNIAKMITAGFTGQLKGWWDNYLTPRNRDEILTTIKQEDGRVMENAVYTLVINIMEHFTGRVSDNNENIRTLLQNLRCKTLTNFRWYKDAFLNRVMELPECNSSHWKSKFIDGLPHLFAERVRKTLRKDMIAIPYDTYTYGELIKTCVQEGLSLCNEIRLNQQIKRQSLLERNQLGQFCSQFGMDIPTNKGKGKYIPKEHKKPYKKKKRKYSEEKLVKKQHRKVYNKMNNKKDKRQITCYKCGRIGHYANKCRMKDKIKNLNLDEELKDSLKKLLINSDSETESSSDTETETDSSGNTEIRNLNETTDSEDNACCSSYNDSLNVLKGNDLIEFLQSIKDKELRSKLIDSMDIPSSSDTKQNEEIHKIDNNPYMMSEVFKTLRQKQKTISETPSNSGADVSVIQEGLIPTKYFEKTTHSLRHAGGEKLQIDFKIPKAYICNNKVCIPESFLLVKNITNQVILGTPFLKQIFPITHIDDKYFEGTFQKQKVQFQFVTEPQTKVLNEIKDIIFQKYNQINFLKSEDTMSLEICNDHPNAFWNRKKHIVSLPYEESFKEQDIPTKSRPCQMNSEYMELCKTEINNLLGKGLINILIILIYLKN